MSDTKAQACLAAIMEIIDKAPHLPIKSRDMPAWTGAINAILMNIGAATMNTDAARTETDQLRASLEEANAIIAELVLVAELAKQPHRPPNDECDARVAALCDAARAWLAKQKQGA